MLYCYNLLCYTSRFSVAELTDVSAYSGSSMHDNDPELLEREKQRNLKNEQHSTSTPHKHAPGWNEYLASTSEAYTKVCFNAYFDMINL
jgi:hypothetical protein